MNSGINLMNLLSNKKTMFSSTEQKNYRNGFPTRYSASTCYRHSAFVAFRRYKCASKRIKEFWNLKESCSRFFWPSHDAMLRCLVPVQSHLRNAKVLQGTHQKICKQGSLFSILSCQKQFFGAYLALCPNAVHFDGQLSFHQLSQICCVSRWKCPSNCKPLFDPWVKQYACPQSNHSAQKRPLGTKVFKIPQEVLPTAKTRTTVIHPQSKAVNELTKCTLFDMLAETTKLNQCNWPQFFHYVMLANCDSVHQSTDQIPSSQCFTVSLRCQRKTNYSRWEPNPETLLAKTHSNLLSTNPTQKR